MERNDCYNRMELNLKKFSFPHNKIVSKGMGRMKGRKTILLLILIFLGCRQNQEQHPEPAIIQPDISTAKVNHFAGQPAIWIHPDDPAQSKIIGSDYDPNGGLFLFNLNGELGKVALELQKPYGVDVEYNFRRNKMEIDIAATVESALGKLRIFVLPHLQPIDEGGLQILGPDRTRGDVAVALYRRRPDGAFFAVVGAPAQPDRPGCLSLFHLYAGEGKKITAEFAGQFGQLAKPGTVPAITVDDEAGYIYYLDPNAGIRKIAANPDNPEAGRELALFGTGELLSSRGSIAIYKIYDGTGYILVSDPVSERLFVYSREGSKGKPHDHQLVKTLKLQQGQSGCEVTNVAVGPQFPGGLLVSPTRERSYNFYSWEKLAGNDLVIAPDGRPVIK